eukprot:350735-Rhodomonas_salina.3
MTPVHSVPGLRIFDFDFAASQRITPRTLPCAPRAFSQTPPQRAPPRPPLNQTQLSTASNTAVVTPPTRPLHIASTVRDLSTAQSKRMVPPLSTAHRVAAYALAAPNTASQHHDSSIAHVSSSLAYGTCSGSFLRRLPLAFHLAPYAISVPHPVALYAIPVPHIPRYQYHTSHRIIQALFQDWNAPSQ